MLKKKTILFILIGLFIVCIAIWGISQIHGYREPLGRAYYREIDIEARFEYVSGLRTDFLEIHSNEIQTGDFWTTDPVLLGMRFAGYPNIDYPYPDKVHVYFNNGASVTVVVIDNNLMDDSTKDKETRVDLVKENGEWNVEWAGSRQRCSRGLSFGWATGLCP